MFPKVAIKSRCNRGVIILNKSNNSQISIETSAPQQVGGFIIKYYFGISKLPRADKKRLTIGSLANNASPIMLVQLISSFI